MTAFPPSFVDLQINGYLGVDFNACDLPSDKLHRVCVGLRSDGVEQIYATVITDELDVMGARLKNLLLARSESELSASVVAGFHVEGPFINGGEGYVGAHPATAVRPASKPDAERLLEAGGGLVRIVTLAPESDPGGEVTRWLTDQGVVVSAGHCNPSLRQLRVAIDQGLAMFTHLGNGCPLLMPRHDNVIQRALSVSRNLWTCFIADGVHVPYFALRNYLNAVGFDRAIVVTDAISAAGLGPGTHRLGRREVEVDEHLATWSTGGRHLVGSATLMSQAFRNLQSEVGLTEQEALLLTSVNPRKAMAERVDPVS